MVQGAVNTVNVLKLEMLRDLNQSSPLASLHSVSAPGWKRAAKTTKPGWHGSK
jgi:hypothetical protein